MHSFSRRVYWPIAIQSLCKQEDNIWIAPNGREVVAAKRGLASGSSDLAGPAIPISEQFIEYVDFSTNKPFYSLKAFHTPGGMIMRAGLKMGGYSSCWPKRYWKVNGIDIDTLLKRGGALKGNAPSN